MKLQREYVGVSSFFFFTQNSIGVYFPDSSEKVRSSVKCDRILLFVRMFLNENEVVWM